MRAVVITVSILAGCLTAGLFAGAAQAAGGTIQGSVDGPARARRDGVVFLADAPKSVGTGTADYDQKGMVFVPRVLPIQRGTTVKFLNSDHVRHNVFSPDFEKYNLGTWPVGESRTYVFDKCDQEICAYTQLCNVHTEMEGFIVVLQSPFFALVKGDGTFSIPNVPAGTYTLKFWSPKKGQAEPVAVTVTDGQTAAAAVTVK